MIQVLTTIAAYMIAVTGFLTIGILFAFFITWVMEKYAKHFWIWQKFAQYIFIQRREKNEKEGK